MKLSGLIGLASFIHLSHAHPRHHHHHPEDTVGDTQRMLRDKRGPCTQLTGPLEWVGENGFKFTGRFCSVEGDPSQQIFGCVDPKLLKTLGKECDLVKIDLQDRNKKTPPNIAKPLNGSANVPSEAEMIQNYNEEMKKKGGKEREKQCTGGWSRWAPKLADALADQNTTGTSTLLPENQNNTRTLSLNMRLRRQRRSPKKKEEDSEEDDDDKEDEEEKEEDTTKDKGNKSATAGPFEFLCSVLDERSDGNTAVYKCSKDSPVEWVPACTPLGNNVTYAQVAAKKEWTLLYP